MADIAAIREGLANNLLTISGLRAYSELRDEVSYPAAMVNLDSVEYDGAMRGGLTTYTFSITLIVGRAAERSMARKLDAYLQPTGEQSVKAGVESDRTLAGECYDLRVESAQSVGSIQMNDQTYLAAEFTVTVYA